MPEPPCSPHQPRERSSSRNPFSSSPFDAVGATRRLGRPTSLPSWSSSASPYRRPGLGSGGISSGRPCRQVHRRSRRPLPHHRRLFCPSLHRTPTSWLPRWPCCLCRGQVNTDTRSPSLVARQVPRHTAPERPPNRKRQVSLRVKTPSPFRDSSSTATDMARTSTKRVPLPSAPKPSDSSSPKVQVPLQTNVNDYFHYRRHENAYFPLRT